VGECACVVSEDGNAAKRTGVVHAEPSVDAVGVVHVAALGQLPHALALAKILQADGAAGDLHGIYV